MKNKNYDCTEMQVHVSKDHLTFIFSIDKGKLKRVKEKEL